MQGGGFLHSGQLPCHKRKAQETDDVSWATNKFFFVLFTCPFLLTLAVYAQPPPIAHKHKVVVLDFFWTAAKHATP